MESYGFHNFIKSVRKKLIPRFDNGNKLAG